MHTDIYWISTERVPWTPSNFDPRQRNMSLSTARCANGQCATPDLPLRGAYCTGSKCKRVRAALGKRGLDELLLQPTFRMDDGSQCFEVYAVYGVSRCDVSNLSTVQQRNQLKEEDELWSYEVFGRFSANAEDSGYGATRKVLVAELCKNLDEDSMKKLAKFDKSFGKKVKAVKQALEPEVVPEAVTEAPAAEAEAA